MPREVAGNGKRLQFCCFFIFFSFCITWHTSTPRDMLANIGEGAQLWKGGGKFAILGLKPTAAFDFTKGQDCDYQEGPELFAHWGRISRTKESVPLSRASKGFIDI
jgi:hypothetical protein